MSYLGGRSLSLISGALVAALVAAVPSGALAQPKPKPKPVPAAGKPAGPGQSPAVVAAVARLTGRDAAVAFDAAVELGSSTDPAAHEALLDALATGLRPDTAIAVLPAITINAQPGDVPVLRFFARYRDPRVRAEAIGALARYPDPTARAAVLAGLRDDATEVRAAAASAAASGKLKEAVDPLLALMARGEAPAARALAQLADADLAHVIGEQLGVAPDALVALALGTVLLRADFGPDPARVAVVQALAKVAGPEATAALQTYIEKTPAKPPRQSRKIAEDVVAERLGGGR